MDDQGLEKQERGWKKKNMFFDPPTHLNNSRARNTPGKRQESH